MSNKTEFPQAWKVRVLAVDSILSCADEPITSTEIKQILIDKYGYSEKLDRQTIRNDVKAISDFYGGDIKYTNKGKRGYYIER